MLLPPACGGCYASWHWTRGIEGMAPSRRYPPAGYVEAGRQLAAATACALVFTGTPDEEVLIDDIRRALRAPSHSLVHRKK